MGPPIGRRCQVSNPLIKRNPPNFINFRPAEEPMKGFSRPMPFLAQKFRSGKTLHTSWPSSHIMTFISHHDHQYPIPRGVVKRLSVGVTCLTLHSPLLNALCLQCFNPSGTHHQDKSYKFLIGQGLHNFKQWSNPFPLESYAMFGLIVLAAPFPPRTKYIVL